MVNWDVASDLQGINLDREKIKEKIAEETDFFSQDILQTSWRQCHRINNNNNTGRVDVRSSNDMA